MNQAIFVAVVAAGASLIAALLTFAAAYSQLRVKVDELLQSQFRDIIAKRIEAYPKLWRIPQERLSDWERLQKPITDEWARALLDSLIEWHVEYGVFLSQDAYEAFSALRQEAVALVRRCDQGESPELEDLQKDGSYLLRPLRREQRPLALASCNLPEE
jgi:hypothetical protein